MTKDNFINFHKLYNENFYIKPINKIIKNNVLICQFLVDGIIDKNNIVQTTLTSSSDKQLVYLYLKNN